MLSTSLASLLLPIILPFFTGVLVLVVPSRIKFIKEFIVIVSLVLLALGAVSLGLAPDHQALGGWLRSDALAMFIFLFVVFFGVVTAVYAFGTRSSKSRANEFYAYFLWTLGAAAGVIFSVNMILFLSFFKNYILWCFFCFHSA